MDASRQDGVPVGPYVVVLYRVSRTLAQRFESLNQKAADGNAFIVSVAPEDAIGLTALCKRLAPLVLVVESGTMNDLPYDELRDLVAAGAVRMLVSMPETTQDQYEALLARGFSGIVQQGCSSDLLARSIRAVLAGELWVPRIVLSNLAREGLARSPSKGLTQREMDIHQLVRDGLTNLQIADRLFISRETVRWHMRRLYAKLGVANKRTALRSSGRHAVQSESGQASITAEQGKKLTQSD